MPRPSPMVLAALAALSAFIAAVVLMQAVAAIREWRLRRDALASLNLGAPGSDDAQAAASVFRDRVDMEEGLFRTLADRIPQLWDLHHLLVQSGLKWTVQGFVLRVSGSGLFVGLITWAITGNGIATGVGLVTGGMIPWFLLRIRRKRRMEKLESQLPDAIDLIARAVRAGHPLTEGLRMAAEESSQPLGSEFLITFEEQRFGLPFDEALMGLGDRVEIVDVRILVTAILVQREVGGNLSEILEQIAATMRDRFNLKRQVRVYTAQGRMSGYTLAVLPIIVGSLISLINPGYMSTLFVDPMGKALLVSAALLQLTGFIWIRRIVDIRY